LKEKTMVIAVSPINRIFKSYLGQVRIAELNSKNPVKRAQGQRDQVSISSEAKAAFTKHAMELLLKQLRSSQEVQAEGVPLKNLEVEKIQTAKVAKEKNEITSSAVISE
jgi:hypothetical protein